jgi:uncharacterized membrane protein (UPF0127 family)
MKVKIRDNKFKVKVMDTPSARIEGMQGKEFNEYFNGMLFLMESSSNCFWMKGCIISLDIIFINNNIVTRVFDKCPPCYLDDCPSYCAKGSIILEVVAGTCNKLGIQKGDKVSYSLL